ncbi:hypothetical protein [Calothrix sp. NIES-3974]|uniref:hypothetical protein n=1 Tax=Calothrix sp. NIES-3974 TaxID=2005462 RepID=UPI000B61720A|nr:hypothetical protein [Calothrix sp. NIES-3974]BAZ03966.1 hypothetical protein NIES3974_05960 [Calothrix sp. NIES-3974]
MNLLREEFLVFILPFAAAFSKPVWESAIALVVGAILTLMNRMIQEADFRIRDGFNQRIL